MNVSRCDAYGSGFIPGYFSSSPFSVCFQVAVSAAKNGVTLNFRRLETGFRVRSVGFRFEMLGFREQGVYRFEFSVERTFQAALSESASGCGSIFSSCKQFLSFEFQNPKTGCVFAEQKLMLPSRDFCTVGAKERDFCTVDAKEKSPKKIE